MHNTKIVNLKNEKYNIYIGYILIKLIKELDI